MSESKNQIADVASTTPKMARGSGLVMAIGAFKLLGAILLAAAGFGIFRLLNKDLGEAFEHIVERLHIDPDNRLVQSIGTQIGGISPTRLKAIGAGTFFYAVLESAEGIGLLLRKIWAEYLTILATVSLLPLEGFEIYQKPTWVRFLVLAINLGVLVYLVVRVVRMRREHARGI